MLITSEDSSWYWFLAGCSFHERVGRFIEVPWDVIEFEAVESVLQSLDFLAVCRHFGVVAARLLHDLVNDQLRVTPNVEASDAQLDGDA